GVRGGERGPRHGRRPGWHARGALARPAAALPVRRRREAPGPAIARTEISAPSWAPHDQLQQHLTSRTCMDYREKSELRDRMRIDWDMPFPMKAGLVWVWDI